MTRPVRVTPLGEIVAAPWRGSLMGNRGRLHDAAGQLGQARWRSRAWIACRPAFRGRWRPIMPARGYTALFFWDEACAFAAGHRPCGECRHADLMRFKAAWASAGLPGRTAGEIDRVLHAARIGPDGRQNRPTAAVQDHPSGAMMLAPDGATPLLAWQGALFAWGPEGYRPASVASAHLPLLTPLPILEVLRAGYRPAIRLQATGAASF
ncbi:MAG: hypothetical protein ACFBRM_03605 [Pikeienuella sp.]